MINPTNDANDSKNDSLPALPVLSPAERNAIVSRARVELFKLLPNVSEADWPFLEMGIQIRINSDPELKTFFWTQPEKAVVAALTNFAVWARTNPALLPFVEERVTNA